jgi:hypothetical protein
MRRGVLERATGPVLTSAPPLIIIGGQAGEWAFVT